MHVTCPRRCAKRRAGRDGAALRPNTHDGGDEEGTWGAGL